MNVAGFRNGSIISNIDIRFASTSAPNNTDIANVLINAAPNITAFTITNVVVSDPVASITTASTTTPVMTAATNATTANITNITPGTNTTTLLTTASTTTANTTAPMMTTPTNAPTANLTNTTPGTNTTTVSTTASTATVNTTTPMMTTPTIATLVTPTTITTVRITTAEPVITKQVQFRSVGETFTVDLQNSSSPAFTKRAQQIKTTLEPIYKRTFPSFRSLKVTEFRNGSIINDIDIRFASASVPNNTDIADVLIKAAPNITAFNISTGSVIVSDPVVSSTTASTTTPMITTLTNATTANLTNTTHSTHTTTVSTTASTTAVNATASTTASNATTANLTNTTPGTNTTTVSTTTGSAVATTTTSSTTAPTTTTTTTTVVAVVRAPIVVVAAVLIQPFVPQLEDKNSPQFKALEEQVVVVYEIIYRRQYGSLFSRVIVIAFRKAGTRTRASTTGNNIEAEVQVVFNSTITPAQIPEAKDVQQTLVNAVSNPNNTFNLSIDNTSVVATQVNIFTKVLQFTSVGETFTADLLNSSSQAFRNRSSLIVTTLEPIYNKTFSSYYSMEVNGFRNGSIITDIYIRFASTSAPNNTDIANVLINAAPNITAFNITNVVVSDSVTVATTATPITTTTAANTTTATPTTTTTAATTTTATPTTTTAVTTAEPVRMLAVKFRSVNGIFTTDLLTSSSTTFKQRATLIRTALEPFYQARFPSFRFINVTAFSNGSIINNMDIGFALSLVPNANQIAQVLIDAAKITPFDIETSSILVDGTPSHGVSHKISLLTASCMLLLSWFLSGQQ
ncbi:pogo transposable element with ZNF domain [Sarotherodon galilaeus]